MSDDASPDRERLNQLGEDIAEPVAKAIAGKLLAEVVGVAQVVKSGAGVVSAALRGDFAESAHASADMAASAVSVATGGASSLVAAGYDAAGLAGRRADVNIPTSRDALRQATDGVGTSLANQVFEAVHAEALRGDGRDPAYAHSRLADAPLDRLTPEARDGAFALDIRCFIPSVDAAQFDGDNRGFSETRDAPSRLSYSVILRPQKGDYLQSEIFAGKTDGPYLGFGPRAEGESRPTATITATRIESGTSYQIDLAGPNPLVAGAPDIDVHGTIQITQPIPGMVQIKADFTGDQFPALESFLTPNSGRPLAIGAFMPAHLALGNLAGDRQRPMSSTQLLASSRADGNVDKIVAARFTNPSTTIDNAGHGTYTPETWSRTVLNVATPDNMPAPQHIWDRPAQSAQTQNRGITPTERNAANDVSGQQRGQRP